MDSPYRWQCSFVGMFTYHFLFKWFVADKINQSPNGSYSRLDVHYFIIVIYHDQPLLTIEDAVVVAVAVMIITVDVG